MNMSSNSSNNYNFQATSDHRKTKNLMRSRYYDVIVKVDADVYHLDKFQLAWKSDYFEKLFTEYSDRKKCNLVELPLMDTDTFSSIVDIIYGEDLTSVLNHDNYVNLIMAIDYLQMDVDVKIYASFIEKNSVSDVKIFRLYDFIKGNLNFQNLLPSVLKYLSIHLASVRNYEEFLFLPLDDIIGIITSEISHKYCLPSPQEMRKICQSCSGWIYHDLESRLPHVTKLVNAAKQKFRYENEMKDQNFSTGLFNTTEQIEPQIIAKTLYNLLVSDGEIKPVQAKLPKDDEKSVSISVNKEDERKKMEKFIENNYFHDIIVRVEEKTYKLHRFKLNSASGYFTEIFSAERSKADVQRVETPTQRRYENQEYFIHDIDQTTFDMIIRYVYFEEMQLTLENLTRVLKATNILRIQKLLDKCVSWMKENIEEVLFEAQISETPPTCLLPFDEFEEMLLSSNVLTRVIFDNPHKIVDICSKWIFHDVKSRYRLIPQVTFAINHNRMMDFSDYKMEEPIDLNNFSEQLIRDKLWRTLRSTSLVSPTAMKMSKNVKREFNEIPVFLASTEEGTIHILNADMDEIASLRVAITDQRNVYDFPYSATLMGDNLFILFPVIILNSLFYVYNLSSRKFISLNNCITISKDDRFVYKYSLLNCRGQVYGCSEKGHVLKYSIELNRWTIFSEEVSDAEKVYYTSDGNKLYRLYKSSEKEYGSSKYVVQKFNFQQNVWFSLPNLSFTRSSDCHERLADLTITSGRKLAVIFNTFFMSFDQTSRRWRQFPMAHWSFLVPDQLTTALTQCEGRFLQVTGNKLYHWSQRDETWELKKELPLKSVPSGFTKSLYPYYTITAVHRHYVCTN